MSDILVCLFSSTVVSTRSSLSLFSPGLLSFHLFLSFSSYSFKWVVSSLSRCLQCLPQKPLAPARILSIFFFLPECAKSKALPSSFLLYLLPTKRCAFFWCVHSTLEVHNQSKLCGRMGCSLHSSDRACIHGPSLFFFCLISALSKLPLFLAICCIHGSLFRCRDVPDFTLLVFSSFDFFFCFSLPSRLSAVSQRLLSFFPLALA